LQATVQIPTPSADSGIIAHELVKALRHVYRPELQYCRASVLLPELIPNSSLQIDLLGEVSPAESDLSQQRMTAIDDLNSRYGKRTVRLAAEDLSKRWRPRKNLCSPAYTSRWGEIPEAKLPR